MGHPGDATNAFQWKRIALNLPASVGYNPALPRVRKLREDGLSAVDMVAFFDDGRVFGPTLPLTALGLRQVTSRLQSKGNQDAARKRRGISLRPGAWAGCIAFTDQGLVRRFTSQAKWEKAKHHIKWIQDNLRRGEGMDRATFKSGQGFLVHMGGTYEFIKPYLHGLFLAENVWRNNRDSHGYRLPGRKESSSILDDPESLEWDPFEDEEEAIGVDSFFGEVIDSPFFPSAALAPGDNPPALVESVPRLHSDMNALERIFSGDTPIQAIERPVSGARCVVFGGGTPQEKALAP
jgi:hypothetical protein